MEFFVHCWTYTTLDYQWISTRAKGDLCKYSSLECDKYCDIVLIYLEKAIRYLLDFNSFSCHLIS